jgi:hypothetical protein
MKHTFPPLLDLVLVCALASVSDAAIVTFEDLSLPPESYWNGADGSGGFASGGAFFNNSYDPTWGSWDGFGYSNLTDTQASGIDAQYSAVAGSGQGDSETYGVAFVGWTQPPTVTLSTPQNLDGLYVTNSNYTYYSMLKGDPFAKKFGGTTGDDEDWFKLTITGRDTTGQVTGTVDFFLADFRFADNRLDYIVDTWQFVDLTSFGRVETLEFALDSSDIGVFGMNTPGYFAIDTVVPEPATVVLLGLGGLFAMRRRR